MNTKTIRQDLEAQFPGHKFRALIQHGAGASALTIYAPTELLLTRKLEAVARDYDRIFSYVFVKNAA